MKVFRNQREKTWHLVYAHSWDYTRTESSFASLRIQFFCQDQGYVYGKSLKFIIEPYSKDKHRKLLCPACVKKGSKSKHYESKIERVS